MNQLTPTNASDSTALTVAEKPDAHSSAASGIGFVHSGYGDMLVNITRTFEEAISGWKKDPSKWAEWSKAASQCLTIMEKTSQMIAKDVEEEPDVVQEVEDLREAMVKAQRAVYFSTAGSMR